MNIGKELLEGNSIHQKLSGGGQLHVDRPLPFLCLYRFNKDIPDVGTERFVLGESVFCVLNDAEKYQTNNRQLIQSYISQQIEEFGAFLILELWAGEKNNEPLDKPGFHIHASKVNIPSKLLDRMESALLGIKLNEQQATVKVSYSDAVSAPGFAELFTSSELEKNCITYLGLEVKPIYRESAEGPIFPIELQQLHHSLAHYALRKVFYAFIHENTKYRLKHSHQLGQMSWVSAVDEVDQQLAEISENFDLLLHVTPVNVAEVWDKVQHGTLKSDPKFLYRSRTIDPVLAKRKLFAVPIDEIDDPTLAYIYSQKQEELDLQVSLIADRDTPRFLLGSRQLFGDVDAELLQLAKTIIEIINEAPEQVADDRYLTYEEFLDRAREEVDYYQVQDPDFSCQVIGQDDISGIMVSHGNFLIGKDASITTNRVNATLSHEIGTHALTYHNGKNQPFRELYTGMAGYEPMQEGIAVLSEYLVGELEISRLKILAGRVIAVSLITSGENFIETFNLLQKDYAFNKKTAFYLTMRIYRSGGYTKDAVYLKGLVGVLDYLSKGKELEDLYIGKVALEHMSYIEELKWRGVLKSPKILPRFFSDSENDDRIRKVTSGMTVLDLVKEIIE